MRTPVNYLKNITKSVTYAAMDIAETDMMPNVAELAQSNKDFAKATYSALKNPVVTVRRSVDAIQKSKVYQALDYGARNLVEDLRTGNFYNKEREDRDLAQLAGMDTNWDDLTEFGIDDDWESKLNQSSSSKKDDITTGDMKIVSAIEGSNAAATSTTVNAIIRTSENSIKNARTNMSMLYTQNERLFGGLHNDLSALNITMGNIQKIQMDSLSNMDKNMSSFFTSESKLSTERNAILKEMLEMQRQQFRSALDKEKEAAAKRKSKKRWSDININGIPNIDAYIDAVKGNISEQISSMGISGFSEDSNMLATFMTSPLKGAVKYIVNGVIPATVKAATKELDATVSGIFGNIIGALGNAKNSDENSLMGMIAKFMGVSTNVNRSLDTGRYEKGPIPFDGITRKAIIDVIPTHLRRIEAAITGRQEEMFDYNSGRWVKMSNVKKQFDNIRKNSINSATSDLRTAMNPGLKALRGQNKSEAESLAKAEDEFYEYLYNNNGRFDPNKSANANKISAAQYPNLYQHYSKIVNIYKSFDEVRDTSKGSTRTRNTRLSVRARLAGNVLSAKDSEQAQYREMESTVSNVFHQYFGAPTPDAHGKYNSKKQFNAFNMLNHSKDSLGNTVFDYLKNINKELTWQRMEWGSKGGSGRGARRGRGSRNATRFEDINLRNSNMSSATEEANKRIAEDDRIKRKTLEMIRSGKAIDLRDFDVDEQEYLLELRALASRGATDEYSNEIKGYIDENSMAKFMDKHFYKTNVRSIEDVQKIIDKANKEGKNTDEVTLSKDEESFFKRLLGKIGANGFIGGVASASGEVFTNLLYTADKAIYEMMYKTDLKAESDGKQYKGFMDMIAGKVEGTFDKLQKSIEENIIKPFKDKFGIDENFETRFKDSLAKMGTGFANVFMKSNKSVYGPAYHEMMKMMGFEEGETRAQKARAKKRTDIGNKIKYAKGENNLVADDFIKLLGEYGLDFGTFNSADEAKESLLPLLYEQMYKSSNGLSELGDNKDYINYAVNHVSKDKKAMNKLAGKYGFKLSGSTDSEIADNFRSQVTSKIQSSKASRDARNRALAKGKEDLAGYADRSGFVGTVEDKQRILLSMGVSQEDVSKLTTHEALNKRFARIQRRNNAKGTFGIPFMGKTMLSKGELLFNSKGMKMVGKTDAYDINEPTHILNSEDSHDLLSALGVKGLGPKSTVQQDLGRENLAKKKIANNANGNVDINKAIDVDTIIDQAKKLAPEGLAGGLVGGTVSLLFGLVGGPLVGAAVGAGTSIISSSDVLKEKLFGKLGDDGKRDGTGIVSKSIMNAVQKYAPNMLKYGMAGIIPGLITPLGPIGGLMAGAALGYVKSNEKFKEKYFGENGELGITSKEKKIIKDMLPNTLKGAGIGAVATLFGGPFGLVGNAAVGAAIGMMTSTDEFKNGLLGVEINGVRTGGVVGAAKDAFQPLADAGREFKDKIVTAIDENLVKPLKEFMVPAIHALPQIAAWIPKKINQKMEEKFGKGFDTMVKDLVVRPLTKLFSPVAKGAGKIFNAVTAPVRLLGTAGRAIERKQIKTMNADYRTADERLAMMGDRNYSNRALDEMLSSIGKEGGMPTMDARSMLGDLNTLYDTERSTISAKKKQEKKIMSILNGYKTEDGKALTPKTKNKIVKALERGDTAQIPQILQAQKLDGSDRGLTKEQANSLLNGDDGLMAELNKYSDLRDRATRAKNATSESRDEATKKLAADFKKMGIDINLSDPREVMKLSKYLQTEIIHNEANPDAEGKGKTISQENNENLKTLAKDVHEISDLFKYFATGDDSYLKGIKKDRESNTAEAINRMNNRYDKNLEKNKQRVGEDNVDQMSSESMDRFTAFGRGVRKDANRVGDGTITPDEMNAMNERDENGNRIAGKAGSVNRLAVIKNLGYYCTDDLTRSINDYSDANFKYANKVLKNKYVRDLIAGRALTKNDVDFAISNYPYRKVIFERAEILTRSGDNGNSFDFTKILEISGRELAAKRQNIERTTGEAVKGGAKTVGKYAAKATGIVINTAIHAPSGVVNASRTAGRYVYNAAHDNLYEGGKYGDDISNHGIGTFLLGSLFKGITGIGKAAVGGVKSLFGKNKTSKAGSADEANGALSAIFGGNKNKSNTGIGVQNSDEVDVPGDGRDVANFGDGMFGLIKRDSSGNIEPDTTDSGTKAVMNKLSLKEKAQNKLMEAQMKACEVIKANFDTSDIKESKKGKLGWLPLLLLGGLLAKSGVLTTLYDKMIKPLWTNGIKPWIDEKVVPWWDEKAKPWIQDVALPAVGKLFSDAISGLASMLPALIAAGIKNLPKAIAAVVKGGAEVMDILLGNDKNVGGSTTVDASNLSGDTQMVDENGNVLSAQDIQNGNFSKIYNTEGVEGTVNKDGTVTFKDQSKTGSSAASRIGNGMAHAFAHGKEGILNKVVRKGSGVLKHFGISGKAANVAAKVISKPVEWAGKAGSKFAEGFDKLATMDTTRNVASDAISKATGKAGSEAVERVTGDVIDNATGDIIAKASSQSMKQLPGAVATETIEDAGTKAVSKAVGKSADKATKNKGLIATLLSKAKDAIEGLFENSKVISKVKDVADMLGVKKVTEWIGKLKSKVTSVFDDALKAGAEKVQNSVLKKAAGKVNIILTIASIVTDFLLGCDQAESILGVKNTSLVEEIVAGFINALCNFLIAPSIIPGTNWIARQLFEFFNEDLDSRQAEADKEYEQYKQETGSTATKEEYLKRQYSVSGKVSGWFSDRVKDVKGAGKWVANKVTSAKDWAVDKVTGAKDAVVQGGKDAISWLGDKASGAKDWIGDKFTSGFETLGNGFKSIIDSIKGIDSTETQKTIDQARDGKISVFSSAYWGNNDKTTGFGGVYNMMTKIVNAPVAMVQGFVNSLLAGIKNIGSWIQDKFSAVGDFFSDPLGFIYKMITGGDDDNQDSENKLEASVTSKADGTISYIDADGNVIQQTSKNVIKNNGQAYKSSTSTSKKKATEQKKEKNGFVKKVQNTFGKLFSSAKKLFGFGSGPADYSMGYSKQIDPAIAGATYNGYGDSIHQTIGDSGCGPTAAVNVLESLYGRGNAVLDAANYAVSRGYKELDGGTKPGFFTDYFNKAGYGSTTSYNTNDIEKNINSGMPTVLMGKDTRGTSNSTPFGKTPHYVTVTGTDGNGHAIVQDPESKYDNQLYGIKDLMRKTELGVSAYGKNFKSRRRTNLATRYGRGRYGRGKSKIVFIGDSRTVMMHEAVGDDGNIWSAKVGAGYYWFKNTGVPAVDSKIDNSCAVAILMGVNDILDIGVASSYAKYINDKAKTWKSKGAEIYYVSVNPVSNSGYSDAYGTITNDIVEKWNNKIKGELSSDVKYIDTYSQLKSNFKTVDNLHYDDATSKNLYSILKSAITNGTATTSSASTSGSTSTTSSSAASNVLTFNATYQDAEHSAAKKISDAISGSSSSTTTSTDTSASGSFGRSTESIGGFLMHTLSNSKVGQVLNSFLDMGNSNEEESTDSSNTSGDASTSGSTTSAVTGNGQFPKYQLNDSQIKGIANIVSHEQPGKSGYMAEASLMANLTDKGGDDKATTENLVKMATGGWFASGSDRFDNYGNPPQDAIDAVKEVIMEGKRTLPRYVDEHDCFSDLSSVSTDGQSFSPSDRSKYVQFKTKLSNVYGASGTFYCFPNSEADPFYYTSEDLRKKWGDDHYQVSGSGGNGIKPRSRFGRSKYGMGDRSSEVWYFLKKKGFTDEAAAGVLGNMYQESGVDPEAIQGNGKGPAAGIVQWENYNTKSSRWKAMSDYAQSQGKDWKDLGSQLEWMWQELNGKDDTTASILKSNGGISALTGAKDAHAAADLFEKSFERAGTPMMENRYKAADNYLSKYKGTQGTEISGVTSGDASSGDSSGGTASNAGETIGSFFKNVLANSKVGQVLNSLLDISSGSSSSSSGSSSGSSSSSGSTAAGDAAKVVQVAQGEVGTKETPQNYVKYNDWYYGGQNQGGSDKPWCAAFVSWVGNKAGVPESIIPKDAYTVTAYESLVKNGGKISNSEAQPGDIIYFTNNGSASGIYHTGIVENNSGGKIGTIEGNSSDMVARRSYDVNSSKVLVARPKYANTSGSSISTTGSTSSSTSSDAPDVSNTLGGNGVKPISKFGLFKDSIYGKGVDSTKIKMSDKSGYHTVEYSAFDKAAGRAIKSGQRKNVYVAHGMGTGAETQTTVNNNKAVLGVSTAPDYSKLISAIINILMTIANNTDKLNTIITILNDKLGVDITEKDVSDNTGNKETLKMKLASSLGAKSAINASSLTGFADKTANSSVQSIISAMNAIASE